MGKGLLWAGAAAVAASLVVGSGRRYGWKREAAIEAFRGLSERLGLWAIPVYVAAHTITLALCLPYAIFFEAGASLLFGFVPAVLCVFSAKILGASLSFWIGRLHPMTHIIQNEGCSSSTSQSSQRNGTDDDRMIAVILSEEFANLDGAVARRLTNLSSIPHVPRTNTYIPKLSDASLDHQRLSQRLHTYGLFEVKVSGDGNCQFRALSDQLYKSPDHHKHVRKEVVKQLKEFRSTYEGYVPMKYKHYYKKMSKSGEWGDHITLQAAADRFGAKICLLTSFRDTCFVEIVPQHQPPQKELWLSFWSEVHYNSIYELRDLPVRYKPKKRHWLF